MFSKYYDYKSFQFMVSTANQFYENTLGFGSAPKFK